MMHVRSGKPFSSAFIQTHNATPIPISDLGMETTRDIAAQLNALLADTFALYLKTKNFHWHVSGPHFRDYRALLDDHAQQVYAATDGFAERARRIGATTLRSIGDIARRQRLSDNDADSLAAQAMLAELREDNQQLATYMAKRMPYATSTATSRVHGCSKPGSMKRSGAFCSSLKCAVPCDHCNERRSV
jgi:DNA-binding ferritin-like protein